MEIQNTNLIQKRQEKNKDWWEKAPMTYEDWDKEREERMPKSKEDFLEVEFKFLETNPFLKENFNFSLFSNKKVLEIGCGSGAASCLFAKNGANIFSVDITQAAIDMTKKNSRLQKQKVNALQMDAEKLNFEDETFDYLFSWGVLHHSQNPSQAFSEASRVLKVGGKGMIMVYNKNSLRYYGNGLGWLFLRGKVFRGNNLESVQKFYTDGYYHKHFTPRELRKELEKKGLRIEGTYITHMNTQMIPYLPKKLIKLLKKNIGWLLVVKFTKIKH